MKFRDPCKRCIVRACCRGNTCDDKLKYIRRSRFFRETVIGFMIGGTAGISILTLIKLFFLWDL